MFKKLKLKEENSREEQVEHIKTIYYNALSCRSLSCDSCSFKSNRNCQLGKLKEKFDNEKEIFIYLKSILENEFGCNIGVEDEIIFQIGENNSIGIRKRIKELREKNGLDSVIEKLEFLLTHDTYCPDRKFDCSDCPLAIYHLHGSDCVPCNVRRRSDLKKYLVTLIAELKGEVV